MKRAERLLMRYQVVRIAEDYRGDPFVELRESNTKVTTRLFEGDLLNIIADEDILKSESQKKHSL